MLHKVVMLSAILASALTAEGFQLLLRGPLLFPLLALVAADCNKESCINGACRYATCECENGFGGEDCSMPFKVCPDGKRKCYNGSECKRNKDKDPVTHEHKYSCDCSRAYDISTFAGVQCEYSSTVVCEIGKDNSLYSFCTNEGECVKLVDPGRPHQGCRCVDSFEGLHCQYLKGEAPAQELAAVAELAASRSKGSGLSGIAMFFIILIPLVVIGMLAYVLYKKKRNEKDIIDDSANSECRQNENTRGIELKSEIL